MTAGPIGVDDVLLVVDVGNTRIKLAAVADLGAGRRLPALTHRQDLASREFRSDNLARWLRVAAPGPAVVLVAGVHETAAARVEAVIAELSGTAAHRLRRRRVVHTDLPLTVRVPEPGRVGIDRLAGAAAAAVIRDPGRPAIVVDCGTATTVDLISAAGEFLGGAILPGPRLLARALAEGTSRLPEVANLETGSPPEMPGTSTQAAIAAGIGWGMRGAVARLVAEARGRLGDASVILTGGSRGVIRDALPGAAELPDLVLAGIALAAASARGR
jgi:type III pantothenate kinase